MRKTHKFGDYCLLKTGCWICHWSQELKVFVQGSVTVLLLSMSLVLVASFYNIIQPQTTLVAICVLLVQGMGERASPALHQQLFLGARLQWQRSVAVL